MLRCPKHGEVPDKYISCRVCAQEMSYRAYCEYQLLFLPAVIAGHAKLLLVTKEGRRHLAFFGFPQQAYCGQSLTHVAEKFKVEVAKLPPLGVCKDCLHIYEGLLEISRQQQTKTPVQAYGHGKSQAKLNQ